MYPGSFRAVVAAGALAEWTHRSRIPNALPSYDPLPARATRATLDRKSIHQPLASHEY